MVGLRFPALLWLLAVGAPVLSASYGGLRGWELDHHPWGQGVSIGAGYASKSDASRGDYMDQYIAASGVSSNSGAAWWATPAESKASSGRDDAISWVHRQVQKQRERQSLPSEDASGRADAFGGLSAADVEQPSASSGGAVVDIKLDSELQEKAHAKSERQEASLAMLQSDAQSHSAPNVEDTVAEQRLQDVYIHDPFSAASVADVREEKILEASRDFKP